MYDFPGPIDNPLGFRDFPGALPESFHPAEHTLPTQGDLVQVAKLSLLAKLTSTVYPHDEAQAFQMFISIVAAENDPEMNVAFIMFPWWSQNNLLPVNNHGDLN